MLFKTKIITEFGAFVTYPGTLKFVFQSSVGSPKAHGVQGREQGWRWTLKWWGVSPETHSISSITSWSPWQHFWGSSESCWSSWARANQLGFNTHSIHHHLSAFGSLQAATFPMWKEEFHFSSSIHLSNSPCLWTALSCPFFWGQGESSTCSSAHLNTSQSISVHLN